MQKNFFILTSLFFSLISYAQDPTFSQTHGANVNLNTALAGKDTKARLSTIYRNQWTGLSGFYKTSMFNFYQYISKTNGYGGIKFMYDNQADIFYSKSASLFYSQNVKLNDILIRPSVEIEYTSRYIDWNKLTFGDMIDPQQGFVYTTGEIGKPYNNYFDFNIGTLFYYKKFMMGLSAHHINQPIYSFTTSQYRLPINYGAQLCYTHEFNKLAVSPFAYYNYQNGFQLFVPGISLMYNNRFNLAFSTRTRDALIFNIGFQNKFLAINYSYDYTISQLSNTTTGGSHEVSLSFKFWNVNAHEKFVEVKSVF